MDGESTSRLGRFIPEERAPSIHWIGGWGRGGEEQSRYGRCGEEKNSQTPPGIESLNPNCPVVN